MQVQIFSKGSKILLRLLKQKKLFWLWLDSVETKIKQRNVNTEQKKRQTAC